MSDRVKHKSRTKERSVTRHGEKKKSKRRSPSTSDDCVIVNSKKSSRVKSKNGKSRKKKRKRSCSGESGTSDECVVRLESSSKSKRLLGERPEFCKNSSFPKTRELFASRSDELTQTCSTTVERRVLCSSLDEKSTRKKSKESRREIKLSSSSDSSQSSDSDDSSGVSGTSSDESWERRRRRKKRKRKLMKKMMKREEKKRREEKRKLKKIMKEKARLSSKEIKRSLAKKNSQDRLLQDINVELADRAKAMAPMTKEQWEKKQSVVRRVYDEETGRQRLIKGDGEILEEIVSRDRHMAINRQATKGDGDFFQSRLKLNK